MCTKRGSKLVRPPSPVLLSLRRRARTSLLFHANRSLVETPEIPRVGRAHCLSFSLSLRRTPGPMDYSSPWRIRVKVTD